MNAKSNGAKPPTPEAAQATRKAQSLLNLKTGIWNWMVAQGSPSMTLKDVREIIGALEKFFAAEIDTHYAAGGEDKLAEMARATTERLSETEVVKAS